MTSRGVRPSSADLGRCHQRPMPPAVYDPLSSMLTSATNAARSTDAAMGSFYTLRLVLSILVAAELTQW
jgi:hypothetical protein